MKESNVDKYTYSIFEDIKQYDENGIEFWSARDLQKVLEYSEWRNFERVIEKAKEASRNSGNVETSHFVNINKMAGVYNVRSK